MKTPFPVILTLLLAGGCSTTEYDPYVAGLAAVRGQVEARSYQTRHYENTRYQDLVTAIIGTLQDYHFRIQQADPKLGTITAYQMTSESHASGMGGRTELTILIRQRSDEHFTVRMTMTTGPRADKEPQLYQKFFSALNKKLHYQSRA
jgi:hypothetical protein